MTKNIFKPSKNIPLADMYVCLRCQEWKDSTLVSDSRTWHRNIKWCMPENSSYQLQRDRESIRCLGNLKIGKGRAGSSISLFGNLKKITKRSPNLFEPSFSFNYIKQRHVPYPFFIVLGIASNSANFCACFICLTLMPFADRNNIG